MRTAAKWNAMESIADADDARLYSVAAPKTLTSRDILPATSAAITDC